jgi:3-hydroxymyristoyl/3-hydroxydecanoyl-(acyl carrier protein) dehydratase
MTLVQRVETLDPTGGRFGLGLIRAKADIHPDDWFMVCHFVDDRVMPGTVMYEGCLHTLRIFLMRIGWLGEVGEVAFEPLPAVANRLRCRGQVVESTRRVLYEVVVKELGYNPEPFAVADALMYADGKPIVEIKDMALRLRGTDRPHLAKLWEAARGQPVSGRVVHGKEQILAFATGKPSAAFGDRYRAFDEGRFIARLPGPPYSFLDKVVSTNGKPWEMTAGSSAEAEYEIPPDAWYFDADRQENVPYAVLLEMALQSCGWVAAFMGSALVSPEPLKFRNLGGSARQHATVWRGSGRLTTSVKMTRADHSAGMIIQHYDFSVRRGQELVFEGSTYFGFFPPAALFEQVGIRDASPIAPAVEEVGRALAFSIPDQAPFPDGRWRMVDRIDAFLPDGGPRGLGLIVGSILVDPGAWYFKAHFRDDPVWPGSLGLESLLQLLKVVAVKRWGGDCHTIFDSPGLAHPQRWVYRGQILLAHRQVTTQAVITARDDARQRLVADGFLMVDGKIIYQMNDFSLVLRRESVD